MALVYCRAAAEINHFLFEYLYMGKLNIFSLVFDMFYTTNIP